jgi:hypothetical protein
METVWPLVSDELHSALKAPRLPTYHRDDKKAVMLDDEWEPEYSWRDPAAHKLRLAVSEWLSRTKVRRPTPIFASSLPTF